MEFTYLEKMLLEQSIMIVLVQAKGHDDQDYYAYLAISPLKIPELSDAIKKGNADIRKYGRIIMQGKGQPDQQVKKTMQDEYAFNNRLLSKLAAVSKMREASIAKTKVYTEVHADLRAKLNYQMSKPHLCSLAQPATSKFASAVEFGEKSNIPIALQECD